MCSVSVRVRGSAKIMFNIRPSFSALSIISDRFRVWDMFIYSYYIGLYSVSVGITVRIQLWPRLVPEIKTFIDLFLI